MFAKSRFCLPNFCGIVGSMEDGLDWERLARYVRTARGPRTRNAIHNNGGPTDTTIAKIETNDWHPTRGVDQTLEKLENGLGWTKGDATRILKGEEPFDSGDVVVVQPAPARIVLLSQVPTFDLLDELRNRVVTDQTKPWPEVTTFTDRVKAMGNHDGLDQADSGHQ